MNCPRCGTPMQGVCPNCGFPVAGVKVVGVNRICPLRLNRRVGKQDEDMIP